MRNPLPVLAAALLTAAASYAGTPLAFKRSDWSVVEPNVSKAGLDAAIHKTCAGGTLVASKAGVNERSHSFCKNAGGLCRIPLVCVVMSSDGTATQSPVDATVLELTVTGIFGADPVYTLFAGPGEGTRAVVREPAATELTYVPPAPAPKPQPKPGPAPKPKPKTQPQPHPKPKPNPKPKTNPKPSPAPGAHAQAELSVLERHWMIPAERSAYDASVDAAKKPTAAALQAAYKKGRETVAANLRDALKGPYNAAVAGEHFDQIDGILQGKNYSGFEVQLRPEEYEALKKVLKTADAHKDFLAPNAAAQYDLEMQKPVDGPDGKPHPLKESLLNEHLLAHQITEKFRGMLPPKPGTSPAVDPAAKIPDSEFDAIPDEAVRKNLRDEYNTAWPKQDTDDKKKALNEQTRGKIKDAIAAAANKPSKFDPGAIRTVDDLKALSPADQKKFCEMTTGDGIAASCSDVLDATNGAMTACMAKKAVDAKDGTAVAKAKRECLETIHPECKGAPNAPLRRKPMSELPKDIQTYCANRKDPEQPITGGDHSGGGTPSAINNNPCPGAKGNAATDASGKKDPTTTAGSDTDPCKGGKDEKKDDPHFYDNLGNGIAFGIGGMLLASFFGGPALILAVGLAAGVGGYYFAKSNDEPKKKK